MSEKVKDLDDKFKRVAIAIMEDFTEQYPTDIELLRLYKSIENFGNMMLDLALKGTGKYYIQQKFLHMQIKK